MGVEIRIDIPRQLIAEFCQRHKIRELALFGSVLRDDFGPDSDIDVLADFEPDAQIGMMALTGIQIELSDLLQRPVDLVTRDGLKPVIKDAVLNSAEVIYRA